MKKVSCKTILENAKEWSAYYSRNNERGIKFIKFALAGDQWDPGVATKRMTNNKENLTFNLMIKHLKRAKAQSKEIEFSLDISPTNKEAQENVEETNAFRLLLSSIILNKKITNVMSDCLDKTFEFGYSFVEVNFERENMMTLNSVPIIKLHKDPAMGFWDRSATHPSKIDGKFCGIKRMINREEVVLKYPHLKDSSKISDKNNTLIDYWYRDYHDEEFILLKTGVYKRKDMMTVDDKEMRASKSDIEYMKFDAYGDKPEFSKTCEVSCIYFKRILNGIDVEKPCLFPTDDLPVPYHDGLTFWHPEEGDFTTPLVYHLEGSQKIHNYVNSQIATQAKNISSDKYFFGDEHVSTQTEINNMKKINSYEGGLKFGGNVQTIVRHQPAQLSESLINFSQATKNEIDEISGAMVNSQQVQQAVISGKALDKITHNTNVINIDVLGRHITFVNTVGMLIKQMIPKIVQQERSIIIKKQDGSGEAITINKYVESGTIINNVKDINNNFDYEITAGASSDMQKENTVRYLTQLYQLDQKGTVLNDTKDIYMRSLKTPDSAELERRVAANMDTNLIKYSQGAISEEDYMKAIQAQKQQQQQQQMQMSQLDPQVQSAKAMADAEHKKADASQFKAETDRLAQANKAEVDHTDQTIKMIKLMMETNDRNAQTQMKMLESHMASTQQMLDSFRTAINDEHAQKQAQEQAQAQQGQQPPQGMPQQGMPDQNQGGGNAAAPPN